MKPRARRITVAAAVLVAVLLAVLAVANWGAVRDHVEAWHFQLTRETAMIMPEAKWKDAMEMVVGLDTIGLVKAVASLQDCPAIFSLEQRVEPVMSGMQPVVLRRENFREVLESKGYRVLEQRFPRRAYVVIRDAAAPEESSPVMWDGVDLPVPTE